MSWLRSRHGDENHWVLPTFQLPGTNVATPAPFSEPEDYIGALKVLIKNFSDEAWSEPISEYLTTAAKKRMLWFFGGSPYLATSFLEHQIYNLPVFNLFVEYSVYFRKAPTTSDLIAAYIKKCAASPSMPKEYRDLRTEPVLSCHSFVGTCPICLDDVYAPENAGLPCNHVVCFTCTYEYIKSQIDAGKTSESQLVCPCQNCTQPYNPYHVIQACDNNPEHPLFVKFITLQVMAVFESSPWTRYCSNKKCNKLIVTTPTRRRVVCTNCNTHSCYKCRGKYHSHPFCTRRDAGYEKLNLGLRLYYIRNGTRPCPQCRYLIEKTEGCDHMTCVKCLYEFCWRCNKHYTKEHFSNPLNCTGNRTAPMELYGVLAPLLTIGLFWKDVGHVIFHLIAGTFLLPYLTIRYRVEIKDFLDEKLNKLKRFLGVKKRDRDPYARRTHYGYTRVQYMPRLRS